MHFLTRRLALAGLFCSVALMARAQLTTIFAQNFNNGAVPWASTGSVTPAALVGAPAISSAELAPMAGNVNSAYFAGEYEAGVNGFGGVNIFTTGFGVQLWVKNPGVMSGASTAIAGFGHPETGGISLNYSGSSFFGMVARNLDDGEGNYYTESYSFGAVAPGGAGSINGWDHLAIVNENTVTTFFVNGVFAGNRTSFQIWDDAWGNGPNDGWHMFVSPGGSTSYTGWADDLKFFTYAQGTFSVSQLDYASAIPEPSTYAALAGVTALGVAAWRRRHRAASCLF